MNSIGAAAHQPFAGQMSWPFAFGSSGWSNLQSLLRVPPQKLTIAQLINQQQELEADLTKALQQAFAQVAPQLQKEYAARAATLVNDVITDCMYSVHSEMIRSPEHQVSLSSFQAAASKAKELVAKHQKVALSMQEMFEPVPHLQMLPSGEILMLRAAPAIENLVLSGGGAKGMAYAPALRVLENLGLLTQLKQVAGSSVGAMTAILLASGVSAKSLQKILNGLDMRDLLKTPADFAKNYPDVTLGTLGFDGGTGLQRLDRDSAESVAHYLGQNWAQLAGLPQWAKLSDAQKLRLQELRNPDFSAPRTGKMLTFADLYLLHQLDPQRFKLLTVTGWNQTRKCIEYFSHHTYPDMPVALAGRISMGIPVLFADVKIKTQESVQRWRDGGGGDNMPVNAVFQGLSGQALEQARVTTLLMPFANGQQAYDALHAPPDPRRPPSCPITVALSGNPHYAQVPRADWQKVHDAGLQVMPVSHGDLSGLSFYASSKRVERAKSDAMEHALVFAEQNRINYRHDVVDAVDAAAALLSPMEQQRFLELHQGDTNPLHRRMCEAILQQQKQTPSIPIAEQLPEKAWIWNETAIAASAV